MTLKIPAESAPDVSPSQLTESEMADMKPIKRSVVQYERRIAELVVRAEALEGENRNLREQVTRHPHVEARLASLEDQNVELWVSFVTSTSALALGSGLISSYPIVAGQAPWQFVVGWSLIVLGILFCLGNRICVAAVRFILERRKSTGR